MKGILKIVVELTTEILEREADSEELQQLIADEMLEQIDVINEGNIFAYLDFE